MTDKYAQAFEVQKKAKSKAKNSTAFYRLGKIRKIKEIILSRNKEISDALSQDFHKPAIETDLTEILPMVTMINLLEKKLPSWMSDEKMSSPLLFKGSKSWIRREGKGNCLILSPWNYPFQLALYPILTAFAAGNTCIVKPSEYTPHTNKIVHEILKAVFTDEEVILFEGDAETSTRLLELPFDHIFFTGSTPVGKIVMKAASKHLASVALELGGKSPVFIDQKTNIEKTVQKIIWGKLVNGGQTCVAPDYILVHKSEHDEFIAACLAQIKSFYGSDVKNSDDYNHIITRKHAQRLFDLIEDAKENGARVEVGGDLDSEKNILSPTILTNVDREMKIMQEEIFGPILPVLAYDSIEDALEIINSFDNALAMYIFSTNKHIIEHLMQETSNGGVTINDTLMAVGHPTLPFGGAGKSGIGKYHGKHGFDEFSNLRSVMKRDFDLGTSYFYPPYNESKSKIVTKLLEKFSSLF